MIVDWNKRIIIQKDWLRIKLTCWISEEKQNTYQALEGELDSILCIHANYGE